jgi:hypothetical protein
MHAPPAIGKFLIGITVPMLFMSSAALADTMRCGSKLIVEGDSSYKARHLCGEPADIVHTSIMRRPSYMRYGRVRYFGDQLVETSVETWTYNFGPNKLMRRLRFVDDMLESIDTLGYGYNPARP